LLYQYRRGSLQKIVTKFLGGPPEGDRVAQYKKALPNQVPVETADQFVTALDRAGLKDVTYHRLAYVYHCPHSLVRVPWLQPVVNEFFLRTLMHPETARVIKRRVVANHPK